MRALDLLLLVVMCMLPIAGQGTAKTVAIPALPDGFVDQFLVSMPAERAAGNCGSCMCLARRGSTPVQAARSLRHRELEWPREFNGGNPC